MRSEEESRNPLGSLTVLERSWNMCGILFWFFFSWFMARLEFMGELRDSAMALVVTKIECVSTSDSDESLDSRPEGMWPFTIMCHLLVYLCLSSHFFFFFYSNGTVCEDLLHTFMYQNFANSDSAF